MASSSGCSCAPAGPTYSIPCPSAKCSPCFLPAVAVPVPVPGPQGPPGPPGEDELWRWSTDVSNNLAMLAPQTYPGASPERDQNSELVFPYLPVNQTSPGPQQRFVFDASKGALRAGGVNAGQWDSALNRGFFSTAFGSNNVARAVGSSILGGDGNTVSGAQSSVAGGQANQVQTQNSFVGGGGNNIIGGGSGAGSFAVIGGGIGNQLLADHTFIGGGQSNVVSDINSSVVGGNGNTVQAKYSVVSGGVNNLIAPAAFGYGFIGGGGGFGTGNRVLADYGAIVGGQSNAVSASASYGLVGGGSNNVVSASYGVIAGGSSNAVSASFGVVAGGQSNRVTGIYGTVGGGQSNSASASHAAVLGGIGNAATGIRAVVVGGGSNSASGDNSIAGGINSRVNTGSTGGMALGSSNTVNANAGPSFALGFSNTTGGGGTLTRSGVASGVVGGANTAVGRSTYAFGFTNLLDSENLELVTTGGRNSVSAQQFGIVSGFSNSVTVSDLTLPSNNPVVMGVANRVVAGDQPVVYGYANIVSQGTGSSTYTPPVGVIAIGNSNTVQATDGVALGKGALVLPDHTGAMVISTGQVVPSNAPLSFTSVFDGGYQLYSSNNLVNGVKLAAGQGSWSTLCAAETKDLLGRVKPSLGLRGIRRVPVHQFRYKADTGHTLHIGPTANDFHAAFSGLRPQRDPQRIETLELDSALLLAVQALDKRVRSLRHRAAKRDARRNASGLGRRAKSALPPRD